MAEDLSNSELFGKLRGLGVDVGPVNDVTRHVYLKKYRTLIAGGPPPKIQQPNPPPSSSQNQHSKSNQEIRKSPATPPLSSAPPPTTPLGIAAGHPEGVVVEHLLQSFDNCSHVGSDTAFLFPSGEVILASRAILSSQCNNLTPVLYNMQASYPVKVSTLSGQISQFLIRGNELVLDLKEKICLVHGIPLHEQRLVFKQQELPDGSTFVEHEVMSGCTLHLVLAEQEPPTITTTFRCSNMNPTLSIHHLKIGFSTEQLSCCSLLQTTPLQPHPQRISLPAHLTHIVHVYDVPYPALWMFLRYLYCRTLKYEGSCECVAYLMCYVLAEWFQVPSLAQSCLSVIPNHLTTVSAQQVLHFSKAINSQPLQHMCCTYMNLPS